MTVNQRIIEALSVFNYPVKPDRDGAEGDTYFTFNYADDRATAFANDEPIQVVAYMQIHFFCPLWRDYLEIKKQIRQALFRAGFTFPVITELNQEDTRHLVFECEIEKEE